MSYIVHTRRGRRRAMHGFGAVDPLNENACQVLGGSFTAPGVCAYDRDVGQAAVRQGACEAGGGAWCDSCLPEGQGCAYPTNYVAPVPAQPPAVPTQQPPARVPPLPAPPVPPATKPAPAVTSKMSPVTWALVLASVAVGGTLLFGRMRMRASTARTLA